ncbi:MAG: glycosyltransferase [Vicinamibacterales bacterium]
MMLTHPLVSVVIPSLSQSRYLREAIASAVSRDFPTEVVVVTGGLIDEPIDVSEAQRDISWVRQSHTSLAAARNRGLAAASGEFVIFLDADDRLLPGAIDAAARALRARPASAMAYGRCVTMGPDGTIRPTTELPAVRSGHHAAFLRTNLIGTPAMAILRRGPLDEAQGFSAEFDAAADYDLYLRLASRYEIHDHGQVVAAHRQHARPPSVSASQRLRDTLAVMRRNRPQDPQLEIAWREGFHNWQEFYGAFLVEEISAHLHAHEGARALQKAITLGRLAPHVFGRELGERARLALQPRLAPIGAAIRERRR